MLESPLDEAVRPGTSSGRHRTAACPLRSASAVLPNVRTGQIADGYAASLLALWEEPFASPQWHHPAYVYLNGRELATTLPADEQGADYRISDGLLTGGPRGACRVFFLVNGPLNALPHQLPTIALFLFTVLPSPLLKRSHRALSLETYRPTALAQRGAPPAYPRRGRRRAAPRPRTLPLDGDAEG